MSKKNNKQVDRLIDYFGSQKSAAEALGIVAMAVSHWRKRGVSAKQALRIEKITGGQIKAKDLVGVENEKK